MRTGGVQSKPQAVLEEAISFALKCRACHFAEEVAGGALLRDSVRKIVGRVAD